MDILQFDFMSFEINIQLRPKKIIWCRILLRFLQKGNEFQFMFEYNFLLFQTTEMICYFKIEKANAANASHVKNNTNNVNFIYRFSLNFKLWIHDIVHILL